MLYMSLQGYYESVHVMHTYMNYSIEDINNMYPYEREIFMLMFKNDKEKEKKLAEERNKRYHGKLSF